jgi:glycosyltransferase involved in cell wall biosynthesis
MVEIVFKRRKPIPRAIRELLGLEMFHHGWHLRDGRRPDDILPQADAHLIAPENAAQKYRCLNIPPPTRTVVSINDCVTAEYRYRWKQYGGGVVRRMRSRLDWLRSFRIAGIERRLLAFADVVCLQTASDCAHYRHCVGSPGRPAIRTLSNGPCPDLFALPADYADRNDILFIADLSSEHGHWLVWLLREVYPLLEGNTGFSRLLVVGRAPSSELMALIRRCAKVEYCGYVANLADAYRNTRVVLSLVFKGYGLITKTLDGMAAGCVVVGGDGAFHGIQGFEHRKQGFVVEKGDAAGMAAIIRQCFEPGCNMDVVGANARKLVAEQFRWEDTFRKLEQVLFADPAAGCASEMGSQEAT